MKFEVKLLRFLFPAMFHYFGLKYSVQKMFAKSFLFVRTNFSTSNIHQHEPLGKCSF
jgi:hypothetical protein